MKYKNLKMIKAINNCNLSKIKINKLKEIQKIYQKMKFKITYN